VCVCVCECARDSGNPWLPRGCCCLKERDIRNDVVIFKTIPFVYRYWSIIGFAVEGVIFHYIHATVYLTFRLPCIVIYSYNRYCRLLASKQSAKLVWRIPIAACTECWTPDDGQRDCPKHVEFHSKNKFEKSVLVVGFVIRICHLFIYVVVNLLEPEVY